MRKLNEFALITLRHLLTVYGVDAINAAIGQIGQEGNEPRTKRKVKPSKHSLQRKVMKDLECYVGKALTPAISYELNAIGVWTTEPDSVYVTAHKDSRIIAIIDNDVIIGFYEEYTN